MTVAEELPEVADLLPEGVSCNPMLRPVQYAALGRSGQSSAAVEEHTVLNFSTRLKNLVMKDESQAV